MKGIRMAAGLCAFLAGLCAVGVIAVTIFFRDTPPILRNPPSEASRQAQRFLDALCAGEFSKAETMLYGSWELGASGEAADPVNAVLWEAYVDSLDYTLVGELYATPMGLAQNVKLIYLELPYLTAHLGSRARELLQERIDTAEDVSELYDGKNGYREELVRDILLEAACQAAEEDRRYTYEIVSLPLVYAEEQWWVVADSAFLKTAFGGMAG